MIDQQTQDALALARTILARRDARSRRQELAHTPIREAEEVAEALLKREKHLADALSEIEIVKLRLDPIPMILMCPMCNKVHVDKDEWATKPHTKHLCEYCGKDWYPARVPTVGVFPLPPA
jgi:hypothetical protein